MEDNIGEFFLLYGRFEQKYGVSKGKIRTKMKELIGGKEEFLKRNKRGVKDPLPYVVRNFLAHVGTNPNTLDRDGEELRTSIKLLKSWLE